MNLLLVTIVGAVSRSRVLASNKECYDGDDTKVRKKICIKAVKCKKKKL